MYEIQITRAGVSMSHDKAAELIANGFRVTVVAVSFPHSIPSDFWAEIMADGQSRARINFAPFRALDTQGAATVSSVAVIASEVAARADQFMADRDAALA